MTNRLNLEYLEYLNKTTGVVGRCISDGESTMRRTPFLENCTRSYVLWRENYITWVEKLCSLKFEELQELHPTRIVVSERPLDIRSYETNIGPDNIPEHMYFAAHVVLANSIPNGLLKSLFHNNPALSLKEKFTFINNWIIRSFESSFRERCNSLIIHNSDSELAVIYKLDYLNQAFKESTQLQGFMTPHHQNYLMEIFCKNLEGHTDCRQVVLDYRTRRLTHTSINLDAVACVTELADRLRKKAEGRQITNGNTSRRKRDLDDEFDSERGWKRRLEE